MAATQRTYHIRVYEEEPGAWCWYHYGLMLLIHSLNTELCCPEHTVLWKRMEILWKHIAVAHSKKALCLTPSRTVWTLHVCLVSVWVLSGYFGFPPTVQIHTSWANWLFTIACRSDCWSMCFFCLFVFILTCLQSTLMQCFSAVKLKIYGNAQRKVLVLKCHSCSINAEDPTVKVEDFCDIDLNTWVHFLTGSYQRLHVIHWFVKCLSRDPHVDKSNPHLPVYTSLHMSVVLKRMACAQIMSFMHFGVDWD